MTQLIHKHPHILAIVPALSYELSPATIPSIKDQTVPVERILLFEKPMPEKILAARLSHVLNDGLKNVNLKDYDYILRVDGDATIPPDFLELNLKGKPDLVGWGFAQLIKVKPFLKYMNGKFFKYHDDSYLQYKFRMHHLKVLPYAVNAKMQRPSGLHHGYKYFVYKGYLQYQFGWEPLHLLENVLREPFKIFYLLGYFKALLSRARLFPTAQFARNHQFHALFSKQHLKNMLDRLGFMRKPAWVKGPPVLQLDTQNKCNLNCVYCNRDFFLEGKHGEMSLAVAERVMREVKGFCHEVRPFQNGEPLLDKRLPEFLALAKKILKAKTVVYTNGTVTQNRQLLLDKNLDEVHFTISAASAETYFRVHGKPLFSEAVDTVTWFAENKRKNQKIAVHFVMVAENEHELKSWKLLFNTFPQVVSQLHMGYKQLASQDCLTRIDNKKSIEKSTLKGKMSENVPCACWNPLFVGVDGSYIQCPTSPYSVNYGRVGEVHALTAWHRRNRNAMDNPACKKCNQKRREWKAVFQKYIK